MLKKVSYFLISSNVYSKIYPSVGFCEITFWFSCTFPDQKCINIKQMTAEEE